MLFNDKTAKALYAESSRVFQNMMNNSEFAKLTIQIQKIYEAESILNLQKELAIKNLYSELYQLNPKQQQEACRDFIF